MKLKDKVTSHRSLWPGDKGIITGIIPIYSIDDENSIEGNLVHVLFPENNVHESYQQSFNSKDLFVVEEFIDK